MKRLIIKAYEISLIFASWFYSLACCFLVLRTRELVENNRFSWNQRTDIFKQDITINRFLLPNELSKKSLASDVLMASEFWGT